MERFVICFIGLHRNAGWFVKSDQLVVFINDPIADGLFYAVRPVRLACCLLFFVFHFPLQMEIGKSAN